jgi:hypothetical protein
MSNKRPVKPKMPRDITAKEAATQMAERKTKVQLTPGDQFVDAVEVPVVESTERWSEYKLEDGTVIRLKQVVLEISKVPGRYDAEGNPFYVTKAQPVAAVAYVPEKLKKGYQTK